MKRKDDFLKNGIGTLVDVTLGTAAMSVVGGSGMSSGLKNLTNLGIGIGVAGRTLNRYKPKGKNSKGFW